MKFPVTVINFKAYEKASGENAMKLAKVCESVSVESEVGIVVCPQHTDLHIAKELKIPVFSQHFDPVEQGKYTGSVSVNAVKLAGAQGSLINHSEKRIAFKDIRKCIELAKKHNITSLCCVESLKETEKVLGFGPDMIVFEPPELIGTGVSVSKTKPDIIKKFCDIVGNSSVPLVGAGISNRNDVTESLRLGAKGVILASGFVKAENPKAFLEDITGV